MPDFVEDRGGAPKVFFIDPDPTIISEQFIETAFLKGLETYCISDDLGGDMIRKVRILVRNYPNLILFFTIDRKGSLKAWVDYLQELQGCHDDCVRIGVLYSEKREAMDHLIKKTFNFDVGITAGSIPLGFSTQKNQTLLWQVLEVNQAMGRRKVIRMKCNPSFRMNFVHKKAVAEGLLLDLSVSHFSARFPGQEHDWDVGTTFKRAQLRLGGRLLMVDALIAIKRGVGDDAVFVFLYHPDSGSEEAMRVKVNEIICQHFQSRIHEALDRALIEPPGAPSP